MTTWAEKRKDDFWDDESKVYSFPAKKRRLHKPEGRRLWGPVLKKTKT